MANLIGHTASWRSKIEITSMRRTAGRGYAPDAPESVGWLAACVWAAGSVQLDRASAALRGGPPPGGAVSLGFWRDAREVEYLICICVWGRRQVGARGQWPRAATTRAHANKTKRDKL